MMHSQFHEPGGTSVCSFKHADEDLGCATRGKNGANGMAVGEPSLCGLTAATIHE